MKLIIAEKPSLARIIASAFWKIKKNDGYYEVEYNNQKIVVTYMFGHLVTFKDVHEILGKQYKKWDFKTLPFVLEFKINDKNYYKVKNEKNIKKQFNIIKQLVEKADEIYIWTDPDREGELLARLLFLFIKVWNKPVYRLWLTDLNKDNILKEFKLKRPLSDYDNLYLSAFTRQFVDYIFWINLTRYFSLLATKKFGFDKKNWIYSVGRVQTAILNILYKRQKEIENFKPETYYTLQWLFEKDNIVFKWKNNKKYKDKKKIEKILEQLKDTKEGIVVKIDKKKKKESFKKGWYTKTQLVVDIKNKLNLPVKEIDKRLQNLYEKWILSYIRTDNNYMNKSDFNKFINNLDKIKKLDSDIADIIEYMKKNNLLKPNKKIVDEKKVWWHTCIYVTNIKENFLDDIDKQIILLVTRRILANLAEDVEYQETKVEIDVNWTIFKASGKIYKDNFNWKKVLWQKIENNVLPDLKKGDKVKIKKIDIHKTTTKPPEYYTEATLLKILEDLNNLIDDKDLIKKIKKITKETNRKLGLWTPATRTEILNTLFNRWYIKKDKKKIILTEKWKRLIEQLINKEDFDPIITAIMEDYLNQIIDEWQKKAEEFVEKIYKKIYSIIKKNKETKNMVK